MSKFKCNKCGDEFNDFLFFRFHSCSKPSAIWNFKVKGCRSRFSRSLCSFDVINGNASDIKRNSWRKIYK